MPGGPGWTTWTRSAVTAEASVLSALATTGVPAPRPVAVTDGVEIDSGPAIVMTRVPGQVQLEPAQPRMWVREMAAHALIPGLRGGRASE